MKLELNKAAEYFIGNNFKEDQNFLHNDKEYDLSVLTYLTHLQNTRMCVKCVFTAKSAAEFIDQLKHLNTLANSFKCPALFIYSAPEIIDSSQFIFGVLYNNQLLLINPLGLDLNSNMVQILKNIIKSDSSKKSHIFDKLYITSSVIKKDKVVHHSSGPICIELLNTINNNLYQLMSQFIEWSELSADSIKMIDGLYCHEISIYQFFVSDQLLEITSENFPTVMGKIRQKHFDDLQSLPISCLLNNKKDKTPPSIAEQNQFLDEIIMNAPEQVLLFKLVNQTLPVSMLHDDELFRVLQTRMISLDANYAEIDTKASDQWGNQSVLSLIKQPPKKNINSWEIDVPGDDSCLFWAVTLAFLLPVLEDDEEFQNRYKKIFGNSKDLQYVIKMLKKYNPFSDTTIFLDNTMNKLIREEFRARVVGFIAEEDNNETFRSFYDGVGTFEDYLTNMQKPSSWGGELEIRAMSMLLECDINSQQGELKQCYPSPAGDQKKIIELVFVNYLGKVGKEAINNHYHFNINSYLGEKYRIQSINTLHSFGLGDNLTDEDFQPNDICSLKDIFEQVLVSEILLEIKYLQHSEINSKALKNILILLSDNDTTHLNEKLDLKFLRIQLQIFAQYASLRYEPFIAKCISYYPLLGVIPLARVGARRVVEFLDHMMEFYPDNSIKQKRFHTVLLDGLVCGKSRKNSSESQSISVRGLFSENEERFKYTADEILSLGLIFEKSIIGYNLTDKTLSFVRDDSADSRLNKIKERFPFSSYRSVIYFSSFEELCTYSDYYAESLKKVEKASKSRHRSSSDGEKTTRFTVKRINSDHPLTFFEWIKQNKTLKKEKSVWIVNYYGSTSSENIHSSNPSLFHFIENYYQGKGITKVKKYLYGEFENIKMDEIDFRGCTFKNVIFLNTDCQLINAQDVVFKKVNITETRLDCSKLDRAKLVNCNISKSTWYHTSTDDIDFSGSAYIEREIKISQTSEDDVITHLLLPNLEELIELFGLTLSDTYALFDEQTSLNIQSHIYCIYLDLEYFKRYTTKIKSNLLAIRENYTHRFSQAASNKLKFMITKTTRILMAVIQIQQQLLQELPLIPAVFDFQSLTRKELRCQDIDTIALINEMNMLRKEIFKREQPKLLRPRFFNSSYSQCPEDVNENLQFFTRSGTLLHRSLRAYSRNMLTRSSSGVENDQTYGKRSSGTITRHPSLTENLLDDSEENTIEKKFESDLGAPKELYLSQMRCSKDRMLHGALEKALFSIKSSMERERENRHPSCYISYIHSNDISEHDNEMIFFLRNLREHLRLAGIMAMLNIVDNRTAYKREDYINQILSLDFVLLICTKSTVRMLQNKDAILNREELRLIEERKKTTKKEIMTIAVMEKDKLFAVDVGPTYLNNVTYWYKDSYLQYLGDLITYLWGINKSDKIMKKYWLPLRQIGTFRSSDTLQKSNGSHEKELSSLNTSTEVNDVDSELYSKFINAIKEKYRYNTKQQSLTYEFNEAYFDLTLVRSKDEELESLSNLRIRTTFGSQESNMADSRSLPSKYLTSLDSLFLDPVHERYYHKRILIQGKPGVGKSTLCNYIAYNWACNAGADRLGLWCDQFDLVLFISLHNIRDYPDDKCDIEHVIYDELLSSNSNWKFEDIKNILKTQSQKILLLLDGFDEIEAVYQSNDLRSSPQARLFHSLIDSERCSTVITSRLDSVRLINGVFDEVIEIVGFSKEEINRFVQRAMRKANISLTAEEELIRMVDQNPHIAAISHIPVNLKLICELWTQKHPKDTKDPITMTQFFDSINNWLRERASRNLNPDQGLTKTTSINAIISSQLDLTEFLKKLAWKCAPLTSTMITEDFIVRSLAEFDINVDDFRKITPRLLSIGLLNCLRQDNLQRRYFYFPHRTFLEFYASLFWLSLFLSEEKRDVALGLLKENIQNSKFEMVWQFVSGHLENMRRVELQKLFFEQLLAYRNSSDSNSSNYFRTSLLILCYEEAEIHLNDSDLDAEIKNRAKQSFHYLLDRIDDSNSEEVRKLVFTWKSCNRLFNSEFIVNEIRAVLQQITNFKRKIAMLTLLSLVGDYNIEILSLLISIAEVEKDITSDICCIISKYFIKKQKYIAQKEIGIMLYEYMLNMLKGENDVLRALSLEWLSDLIWRLLPPKCHEIAFSVLYAEYLRKGDKTILNALSEIDLKKISEKEKFRLFNLISENIFKESSLSNRSSKGEKINSFNVIKIFIPKLVVSDRLELISITLNIFKSDKSKSPYEVLGILYCLFKTASYEINNEKIINEVVKELCKVTEHKLLIQVYSLLNIILGFDFDSNLHEDILQKIHKNIMNSSQKDKKLLVKILGKLYLKSKHEQIKDNIIDIIISLFGDGNNKNIKTILLTLIKISDQLSLDHVRQVVPELKKYCADINLGTIKITFKLLSKILQECQDHDLINLIIDTLKNRVHHVNSSVRLTIVMALNFSYSCSIHEVLSNELGAIFIDMLNDDSNDVIIAALNGLQNINIFLLKANIRDKYVTEILRMWNHSDIQIKEKISCILSKIDWAKMPDEISAKFKQTQNELSVSGSATPALDENQAELLKIEQMLSSMSRTDKNDELKSLILNMVMYEAAHMKKILELLSIYLNKHIDPLSQDIIKYLARFNSGVLVELINESGHAENYAKLLYWLSRSKNLILFKQNGTWNIMNESEEKIILPEIMNDSLNQFSEEIREESAPTNEVENKEGCVIL